MKLAKQRPPVYPRQTAAQAFTALMEQHLFHIGQWEDLARAGVDPEGVHQLRVTLRRMRSALRLFRPALSPEVTRPWSDEMRDLANELGPARDLDVFLDEGLGAVSGQLPLPGGQALRERAETQRSVAYERVRALVDGQPYTGFKRDFADWLAAARWEREPLDEKRRRRLEQNVLVFARRALKKQRKRVLAQGESLADATEETLHRLRIECKKLRYAGEFFEPLFPGMDAFIGHLKGLQDVLGVMNDVAVTRTLLDSLLADGDDPAAQQYAAGLLGWRCCEASYRRRELESRWREFREAGKPWKG
ncbi:MAG: CHAD domain-containing protein [Candidatus Competibacterales bacterium]|nr:CHAD domain-containing protein [Candidatus Competibacterales bacterium]